MDKVRLDFYRKLAGNVVVDDKVTFKTRVGTFSGDVISVEEFDLDFLNGSSDTVIDYFIESFADRENKGVQPVPDGFPVVVVHKNGMKTKKTASQYHWCLYGRAGEIKSWKPDYNKILEMQKEHDAKQEKPIEELMINAKESKMSNVYTQKMKNTGVTASIGMKVKVLNKDGFRFECGEHLIGQSVKVLSEPLLVYGHINVQAVEFEGGCYCFRSCMLHPIKSKEELEFEEAKASQVKEVSQFLRELAKSTGFNEAAEALQENGMLAEIVLPLEDK